MTSIPVSPAAARMALAGLEQQRAALDEEIANLKKAIEQAVPGSSGLSPNLLKGPARQAIMQILVEAGESGMAVRELAKRAGVSYARAHELINQLAESNASIRKVKGQWTLRVDKQEASGS